MIVWQHRDHQDDAAPSICEPDGTRRELYDIAPEGRVYRRALAWDVTRCNGEGCALRETCLRCIELANMGPMTPQVDKMHEDPDLCEYGISL